MRTGLWIDHSKAVIVSIAGNKEILLILESNIKKHFRSPVGKNDSNPNGRRNVTPDDIQDRGFTEHMRVFYKKVISCFREAESILIFGPGEPKGEIAKLAQKSDIPGHIVGIETVGKMTDRQIAAKTRDYYHDRDRRADSKKTTGHSKLNFRKSRRRADCV